MEPADRASRPNDDSRPYIPAPTASRRSFLGRLAGALAGATAVNVGAIAATSPAAEAATDPITPAEWLAEMRQLGWTAKTVVCGGLPLGVYEYGPDGRRDWAARARLLDRVSQSGPDFYRRAARHLFELGLYDAEGGPNV